MLADPIATESCIVHEQAPAGTHDGKSIEPLFSISDGEWHINCRQSHGRQLRTGHRTRAAQRNIGRSVGQIHSVDVSQADVWRFTKHSYRALVVIAFTR
jgi:hypothetical protein